MDNAAYQNYSRLEGKVLTPSSKKFEIIELMEHHGLGTIKTYKIVVFGNNFEKRYSKLYAVDNFAQTHSIKISV